MNSTFFALMAEFETGEIPLDEMCGKYFGLSESEAKKRASLNTLPVPAYHGGSNKSPWLVSTSQLATYLDKKKELALADWKNMNGGRTA